MSHPVSECPEDMAVGHLAERRFVPRHQTSKIATILLQRRPGVVCAISNISPAGALLLVGNAHDFPDEFDLQVDSYRRRCVAKWRRIDRIGVQFKSFAGAH